MINECGCNGAMRTRGLSAGGLRGRSGIGHGDVLVTGGRNFLALLLGFLLVVASCRSLGLVLEVTALEIFGLLFLLADPGGETGSDESTRNISG